jgi:hypothetical protein
MEESFWEASVKGDATGFYARHMTTDGFVVLPNRILTRDDLVTGWGDKQALRSYELSQPAYTLIEGGNVIITYEVSVEADWLTGYEAYVTVVYTWLPGGWALVCRSHTPKTDFPF